MKQINFILIFIVLCIHTVSSFKANPEQFSWDNIEGVTYLGPVKNQNFPYSCNGGWAFSTIGMLESRIKYMRKAASPDISLSTQVLLSCDFLDFGCTAVRNIFTLG